MPVSCFLSKGFNNNFIPVFVKICHVQTKKKPRSNHLIVAASTSQFFFSLGFASLSSTEDL
jgi:hypothetical protein